MSVRRPRLRLRLTAAAESAVRAGHPWVFANSIREQNRDGERGELAVIYDRRDRFLAVGLFDPESALRVRVLHVGAPLEIDEAWWRAQLDKALARRGVLTAPSRSPNTRQTRGALRTARPTLGFMEREETFADTRRPASIEDSSSILDEHTTACRLINGESDGWPGLVLDCYERVLVLKLYTAAWLPRLTSIVTMMRAALQPQTIVLRLSRNVQSIFAAENYRDGQIVFGAPLHGPVVFRESGFRFEADVVAGQKTGFFLDQRENRRAVEKLARDAEVLNAFSYSGGFSLYTARGGARSVASLDISAHALAGAERNIALNQHDAVMVRCRHELIQANAFDWLEQNDTRKFDLIILDPPSLAKRETERPGAIRAYEKLAGNAIRRLRPRGTLVAGSCSAHVSAEEFFATVQHAAATARRKFAVFKVTGHAPDHPATFPEAQYLKCIYLRFAP